MGYHLLRTKKWKRAILKDFYVELPRGHTLEIPVTHRNIKAK